MSMLWLALAAAGFSIQPPGSFHAGEAVARDGESWLALRVDDDQASLQVARLQVRAVHDELLDAAGERSGLEVSSSNDDQVVAYLRGKGLQAGPIKPATIESPQIGANGASYLLTFGDRRYRIATACDPQPRDTDDARQLQFDCRVELHADARTQVLAKLTGYREQADALISTSDEGGAVLLFAGDLDRDGELDLIFDTTDHYNVSRPTLFLSSQAGPGELLHQVAQYQATGC